MICKCPNCNGALEYDPGTASLRCEHCGNIFKPEEMRVSNNSEEEFIEFQIYTCTSCAGELVVNDVEMATFCPYCGQPTIVFSRASKERRPKYILPFTIDENEAIKIAREHFQKGIFVPKEVKKISDDMLRGIYIPYYLVDLYYHDRQRLMGADENDSSINPVKYFVREAECDFEKITCDASKQLNDETSQRLEPFHIKELKEFEPTYLSGFYADMCDENKSEIEELAKKRAEELFNRDVRNSCVGVHKESIKIVSKDPKSRIKNVEYALFPVWFLTFRYKKKPYTILINGQTGKFVGTIPFQKGKMISLLIVAFLGVSAACTALSYVLNMDTLEMRFSKGLLLIASLVFCVFQVIDIIKNWSSVKRTQDKKAEKFVKERQEKM